MRIAIIVAFVLSSIASAQTAGDYFLYQWDGTKNVKVYTTTFPAAAHNQAWSTITSTPTTLSGYGITDALTSSSSLSADNISSGSLSLARIAQSSATSGQALAWNGTAWAPTTISASGSVTIGASSVSLGGTLTTLTSLTNLGVSMANNTAMTGFALGTISDTTARPFAITQTWNNASLVGSAFKITATDTSSSASSMLMEAYTGASLKLGVSKTNGFTRIGDFGQADNNWAITSNGQYWLVFGNNSVNILSSAAFSVTSPALLVAWGISASANYANSADTQFVRPTAHTWSLGGPGATTYDYTLTFNATTGTNAAGKNGYIDAPNGTGTGGSGQIIFRAANAGSSGSTANTFTNRMAIGKDGIILYSLPTSASGLATGTLWNNAGVLSVAP